MRKGLFLFGLILSLIGCQRDTIIPLERTDAHYFPLITQQYSIFQVEEIRYSLLNGPDTSRYQLKEVVADSFPGNGGEIIYTLRRYTRADTTAAWSLDSVWTARRDVSQAVVVENNTPLVKLIFPLVVGQQWDGNRLNSAPPQMYTLQRTSQELRPEMMSPLDTLLEGSWTVVQQQVENLVNEDVALETYVGGVGLFYRKNVTLEYCARTECIGDRIIEAGRDYRQTLVAYGKE